MNKKIDTHENVDIYVENKRILVYFDWIIVSARYR